MDKFYRGSENDIARGKRFSPTVRESYEWLSVNYGVVVTSYS